MESNIDAGRSLGDSFLIAFLLARDFARHGQDPSQLADVILKAVPAGLLPAGHEELLRACRAHMDQLCELAVVLESATRVPGATPSPASAPP